MCTGPYSCSRKVIFNFVKNSDYMSGLKLKFVSVSTNKSCFKKADDDDAPEVVSVQQRLTSDSWTRVSTAGSSLVAGSFLTSSKSISSSSSSSS